MILLITNNETLTQLRVTALPFECDPYVGFANQEIAARFCDAWHIPSDRREFAMLKPGLLKDNRGIALFESQADLESYLAEPQNYPCQRLIVRSLKGWLAFVPPPLRRFLRPYA